MEVPSHPDKCYLVDIICTTFNHSKYIEATLNGFAMQQTDFDFACLIYDDASVDNAQDIISQFIHLNCTDIQKTSNAIADVIIAKHRINHNCIFIVHFLHENHYQQKKSRVPYFDVWRQKCKYEAMCEGDDYWTDPLKLQKQVDFLESHEEYVMCYTDYDTVDSESQKIEWGNHEKNIARSFIGDNFRELLKGNYPQTMTILYRASVVQNPDYRGGIDYALSLGCALFGKCAFLADKTACYRLHGDSAIHTATNYVHSASLQAWENYVDLYLSSPKYKRNAWEHMLICGTINACLISKKRCGGVHKEQADRVLQNHPELKKYIWLGVLYRMRHTIMKRLK